MEENISVEDNVILLAPLSVDEVKSAVFQIHPDKSTGLDRFTPGFFQKFWNLINMDMFWACSG